MWRLVMRHLPDIWVSARTERRAELPRLVRLNGVLDLAFHLPLSNFSRSSTSAAVNAWRTSFGASSG